MNAQTPFHAAQTLPAAPFRLTFSAREIANWALAHLATPNSFGGRSGSGTLDTVGHLMAVAACVCQPLELDPHWCRDGGTLPFQEIPLDQASVGDILVFDMNRAPGWQDGWPWSAGILTDGAGVDSATARLCHAWHGHACTLSWLKPYWRPHLVRAHRFDRKTA